jgi:Cu+-exporting ATPase
MGEPLRPLPLLVRLSRETVRIIRQNILVFAFGVNLVGVILTGWLWPLFAPSADWYERAPLAGVLYHQLGSLAVLLNSMRLLAFERTAASPTLGRVRAAGRAIDRWLSTASLDELVHVAEHHRKRIGLSVALAGAVAWGASGFARVEADEVGVVQRFGKVEADLAPGLHLRWPWPIETVTRVRPDEVRTIEVGFRPLPDDRRPPGADRLRRPGSPFPEGDAGLTWGSRHAKDIDPRSDESVMITGDGDLVDIFATVRYRAADPRKYLFGAQNPEAVIRSATESVLRELVAGARFLELLSVRRASLEREALERLRRRLAEVAPDGLGVALDGLTLHDLHPPEEVVSSYHAVAKAIQERDRVINEAEADALRTRRRAEEEADRVTRRASAEAHGKLEAAKADRDAFLAWHRARAELTPEEEEAHAAERATRVKAGQNPESVDRDLAARRKQILDDRRAALETRLTFQAAVEVLRQRDKVLIDAADVPGKRQLFLLDPELLRIPLTPRPGEP